MSPTVLKSSSSEDARGTGYVKFWSHQSAFLSEQIETKHIKILQSASWTDIEDWKLTYSWDWCITACHRQGVALLLPAAWQMGHHSLYKNPASCLVRKAGNESDGGMKDAKSRTQQLHHTCRRCSLTVNRQLLRLQEKQLISWYQAGRQQKMKSMGKLNNRSASLQIKKHSLSISNSQRFHHLYRI